MRAAPLSRSARAQWRPRAARTAAIAACTAVALLASACSSDPEPAPFPRPIDITVDHDGELAQLQVVRGSTVGDALAAAKVKPVDGQLRAAKSKKAIKPNGDAAVLRVEGHDVHPDTVLRRHTTIEVIDGTDTVEDTRDERRTQEPKGLPDALQYVQFPGKAGVEDVVVGVTSGEVVEQTTVRPAVDAHRATGKVLALTFDDGPDPRYTPKILDILKQKGVKATFCEVGTSVEAHPELTKRIHDEGHQLCNHTVHHVEGLEDEPAATIEAEVSGGRDAILDASGEAPPYYRPPGGSLGPAIYASADEHDEAVLYWSIDPRDWKQPPPGEILTNVVTQLTPGAIILLHDGGGNREATVAVLPAIIDFARALGYTFTPPISSRSQVG